MTTPQRYKVGYYTDDWGMRSSTPSLLPDPNGPVVRFEEYAKLEKQRDELNNLCEFNEKTMATLLGQRDELLAALLGASNYIDRLSGESIIYRTLIASVKESK